MWEMDGAAIVTNTVFANIREYWHIAEIGDYNGDSRSDILWRDDLGATVLWEMNGPNLVQGLLVNTIPTNWDAV
jgi:hypothetical protein